MIVGKLRHRVTIESYVETQDAAGQPIKEWETFARRWAGIYPLRGRDLFNAQEKFEGASVKIVMRYLPGLNSTMRIIHGETPYDILDIADVDMLHDTHECICQTGITLEGTR